MHADEGWIIPDGHDAGFWSGESEQLTLGPMAAQPVVVQTSVFSLQAYSHWRLAIVHDAPAAGNVSGQNGLQWTSAAESATPESLVGPLSRSGDPLTVPPQPTAQVRTVARFTVNSVRVLSIESVPVGSRTEPVNEFPQRVVSRRVARASGPGRQAVGE